jgi:SAM-dependent methyltransferase
MHQVDYYNEFGKYYRDSILSSSDPSVWTTDMLKGGKVFKKMSLRVKVQDNLINDYFQKTEPIIDLGCGFGRQCYRAAKMGYRITGIDNSQIFIEIAKQIFSKNQLKGDFICNSIFFIPQKKFKQVLLLDVFEHIPTSIRKAFIKNIKENIITEDGVLIISFPFVKYYSVLNALKFFTSKFVVLFNLFGEEHPYPIPTIFYFKRYISRYFNVHKYFIKDGTVYWVIKNTECLA